MKANLGHGHSLDIFRDPDGGPLWLMSWDDPEDEDADLEPCSWEFTSAEGAHYEFVSYALESGWQHLATPKVIERANRFAQKKGLPPLTPQ